MSAAPPTTVGIIGAGPAGLVLGNLLLQAGIDCLIVERQSREHCEQRVRAGLLEAPTVDLLRRHGWAQRLLAEGMAHDGTELRYRGRRFRLDYGELVGRAMHVYPQQELVVDLIAAFLAGGGELHFEVPDAVPARFLPGLDDGAGAGAGAGAPAELRFGGTTRRCRVLAGCDGFFGASRDAIVAEDAGALTVWDRHHEFGWVAMLAAAPPSTDEIVYALGGDGFAGHMLRTASVSRYYVQCPPNDTIENWSDDRIWSALHTGLAVEGWTLTTGPVIEKNVVEMRSHVVAPMRVGSLFLLGDAAHIVPPVGAKGMNLAIADACVLFDGLRRWLAGDGTGALERYSDVCLERVWRVQDFSMWMAWMLHPLPMGHPDRAYALQRSYAQLRYLETSRPYQQHFAENYVGFPLPVDV